MDNCYDFQPDWVSSPGESIGDILHSRRMSPADFAARLGCTTDFASDLLHGRAEITADIAKRLKSILGGSVGFWLNRESQYRNDLARLSAQLEKQSEEDWLRELPISDMIKFGWIQAGRNTSEKVEACLHFFGVPDPQAWRESYRHIVERAAFRTSPSFDSKPGAVAAWLRQGEIESSSICCRPWNSKRFAALVHGSRPNGV